MKNAVFGKYLDGFYDVSNQVKDDLSRKAGILFRQQEETKSKLTNIASFEKHRRHIKTCFLESIGGLPEKRTSLNAQTADTIRRKGFTMEKIIYESLPHFYVTSLLYLPESIDGPTPTVVFVHGHSDIGKSFPPYQAVCVDLVNNGFVVFAIDPPGQGERSQYYDSRKKKRIIGNCCEEHTYAGFQYVLTGTNVARHFIWDVMRGIDYLETRPEVDKSRIGITGNSGGGTQTCYLMMTETRLAAAMPCTFVTSIEEYMKTGQAQDSEQIINGALTFGLEHDDYLTAMAPKPVLIGAAAYDYFPIEGAIKSYERSKNAYKLYGAEDKIQLFAAPEVHCYSPPLRETCVNWFIKIFRNRTGNFKTGDPKILPDNRLWCTPGGQISDAFKNSRTIFDLNMETLSQVLPVTTASLISNKRNLRKTLTRLLGMPPAPVQPIHQRIISRNPVKEYRSEKLFFFSAPDILLSAVMIHPKKTASPKQTDIVLFEHGTDDIPKQFEKIKKLLDDNHRAFVLDVRGVGGVSARPINASEDLPRHPAMHNTEYKLASDAMMLGQTLIGLRVFDVLRGYDYLSARDNVEKISLYGLRTGALWGYFAACLEGGLQDMVFEEMLYSYKDIVETRYYDRTLYNFKIAIPGILKHFDIPDLLPCLAPRRFKFINPLNAKGESP